MQIESITKSCHHIVRSLLTTVNQTLTLITWLITTHSKAAIISRPMVEMIWTVLSFHGPGDCMRPCLNKSLRLEVLHSVGGRCSVAFTLSAHASPWKFSLKKKIKQLNPKYEYKEETPMRKKMGTNKFPQKANTPSCQKFAVHLSLGSRGKKCRKPRNRVLLILFSVYTIGVEMIQTFLPCTLVSMWETDWIVRV